MTEMIIAIISIAVSIVAVFLAGRANNLNAKMFKRQGVIDLHMAWQGVNEIDKNKLITPDVVKAVNALGLTASLWNHDIIERTILFQSYWHSYQLLYDQIDAIDDILPGYKKTCKSFITTEIKRAYQDMKNFELNLVNQSKL